MRKITQAMNICITATVDGSECCIMCQETSAKKNIEKKKFQPNICLYKAYPVCKEAHGKKKKKRK